MYKKVSGWICRSPRGVEPGVPKIAFWNTIIYKNLQRGLTLGLDAAKISIISKNASTKNCWELNSIQKSKWMHMSISLQSGARGSKDWCISIIIMYWNGKVDSVQGSMLPKIWIVWKNALNNAYFWQCRAPNWM